ncbi:MAG: hypothetical protein BGO12_09475 [Verrucomicrobia bacterium 61-8]|nr:MAG: hypothetical protein BGO12_09475 [Verrucomicrobia bacterium 61-8]
MVGILCLCASTAWAKLELGTPFQDGAVLQREKPVPIWGTADPGAEVKVDFAGQSVSTKAGPDGKWSVHLAALSASAAGSELTVSSAGKTRIVHDILVGEVWVCSGQSNMAFKVKNVVNAEAEMAAANFPQIRQLLVSQKVANEPQAGATAQWSSALPGTVGNFSATAFFFGRKLYQALGVPIGLINASVGGTGIEAWMSAEGLAADPSYPVIKQRWSEAVEAFPVRLEEFKEKRQKWAEAKAQAESAGKEFKRIPPRRPLGPGDKNQLSGLFNGMVHPLLPYAVRGIIWYQGEHNAFRHSEYASLFQGLIGQWRKDFGQGDIPFYFVQLPNLDHKLDQTKTAWAFLREAQSKALSVPQTGMAITIDVGNPNDVHPKNKQDVGKRLGLLALARTYAKGGVASGPLVDKATVEGNAIRVSFREAEGLEIRGNPESSFSVAGADGVFHPATARVTGNSVMVTSSSVSHPEVARYAWANNPAVVLFNGAGLPAAPFQTKEISAPMVGEENRAEE